MKHIAKLIDRLLLRTVWWIGSPVRGLPEPVDVWVLPEVALPGRPRWATA